MKINQKKNENREENKIKVKINWKENENKEENKMKLKSIIFKPDNILQAFRHERILLEWRVLIEVARWSTKATLVLVISL